MSVTKAQKSVVRKNSTGSDFERRRINFIEGSNVTLTVADDPTDNEIDVTIASSGGSGGVSDGDKGDITVSASGATWTIDNDVVTYAKMQNVSATSRILGRSTAGAGDVEELSPATVRTMINVADGATANDTDANLKNRANHTGTQTASTISDFNTAADARITAATGVSVQAYDADLGAIAALSPSNDDVIQRKAGAWTNRTMAQLRTDLSLPAGSDTQIQFNDGGSLGADASLVWDKTNNRLGIGGAASVDLHAQNASNSVYARLQGASDGDNFSALELWNSAGTRKWQFALQADGDFAFNHNDGVSWSEPFRITDGNLLKLGKTQANSSEYFLEQDADYLLTLQRDGGNSVGSEDAWTLVQIKAPDSTVSGDQEATLALTRVLASNGANREFLDLYNNGYSGETQYGIRVQKRGTGVYRPFVFDFFDGTTKEDYMRIVNGTGIVVNEGGLSAVDVRVEGDTDANLLFVDASTDRVGIGNNAPTEKLDVTGNIKANNYLLNSSVADDSVSGTIRPFTAAENLVFGDVCYMNSAGKMAKADADAIATSGAVAIATGTIASNATGNFMLNGVIRDDSTYSFTIGGLIYLSTTAGAVTQTAPSGTDDVVQVLGWAITADEWMFNPSLVQTVVA